MSNKQLAQELRKARPKLRAVSPLAHWIICLYGVFNVLLGISFLLAIDATRFNSPLLIVNEIFSYDIWGAIFIAVGVLKLYSLKTNNWALSRRTLLIGVAIKAAWALALIVRIFVNPGTIFVTLLWVTLALVQIATYIFFMPPSAASYLQRREDRENA